MANTNNVLRAEALAHDSILFRRVYHDIAGDLQTGLILAQIVYWFTPAKDGWPRLRVQRKGRLWLAKKSSDWWDECRVKERSARRSIKKLQKLGVLDLEIHKFKGTPQSFIFLKEDVLNSLVEANLATQEPEIVTDIYVDADGVEIPQGKVSDLAKMAELPWPERPRLLTETTTKINLKQTNSANALKDVHIAGSPSLQVFTTNCTSPSTPAPSSTIKDNDVDKSKLKPHRRSRNESNMAAALKSKDFTVNGNDNRHGLLLRGQYFLNEFESWLDETHPVLSKEQWHDFFKHLQVSPGSSLLADFKKVVFEFFEKQRDCDYHAPYFAKFQLGGDYYAY